MRITTVMTLGLALCASLLSACGGEGSDGSGEADVPSEAVSAVDAYIAAMNDSDGDAFLAVVNEAVYAYVFSGTSFAAEGVASGVSNGDFVMDQGEDIAVKLDHTIANIVYVAISGVRLNTEPEPVNGIMVLEVQEYPDRGWLITLDHRFGM